MKKKILFIITKSKWGGAQRYVYDIVTNLDKNEFEASVALGYGGALADELRKSGVKTHLIKTTRNVALVEDIKTFVKLLKIISEERPDIVHLNSSKIGGIGAVAARIMMVPKIIFTVHGWAFEEDRPMFQKIAILFTSWLSSLFHHRIICVSEHTKNGAKSIGRGYDKCITIHNAVKEIDFENKKDARNFLRKKTGSTASDDAVWIGTISELTKNKGLEYSIKALNKIKDLDWVFVIMGEGELRTKIQEEIKIAGLENRIYLAGHIENAPKYLKALDIFTLSSVKEGLPYVLLEAGSAGIPVVATNVGGISEIIRNERSGLLVPPKDPKAISNALEKLIKNTKTRENYGNHLKNRVEANFKFEIMIEKTNKIYKQ
ncbi:MAG: hypothetical protein COU46_01880 [Candidatus Niyogibacteria bacterium CG10_big_fil_rev_8_21_14_0_10_42_19]|uniref:Glycosyltransferase family 1 protein n=1 Tax=Candidatus Niyogibacteria bacterium CG10_big_fil_rev_8_21_14_0_10_42_19 TaxID=1974725 RepID=A0A2H0TFL8_9BACT|nr:MAG: hypothetical protein COU46_01880 [Candidatus Niyogibacteria bacterium CG10_big_fil_rev_8_21_14_0_10_42_19]